MGWSAWTHYVLRDGVWHRCPRNCGAICDWRPAPAGVVVDFESRRAKR